MRKITYTRLTVVSGLLFLASCAAAPPVILESLSPDEQREELVTGIRTAGFDENHKEVRKLGHEYLKKFADGPEIDEVRILTGNSCIELEFLAEAKQLLAPLTSEGTKPETRSKALILLAGIDKSRGDFYDAAVKLLFAMSSGPDRFPCEECRNDLSELATLLSAGQLDRIRREYPLMNGIDIIIRGSLSYATAAGDTASVSLLKQELASADSFKTVPDRVVPTTIVPSQYRGDKIAVEGNVRIGLLCPLSGRFAPLGEAFMAGAALAMKEARARGATGVELIVGDTRAKPLEARAVAERMIKDENVSAIIGGVLSSSTIAAAQIAQINDVVLYSPVASESGIDEIGDNIFQALTNSETEIAAVARIACGPMGLMRIAFLSVDNARSRKTEALFRKAVEQMGGELVLSDFYEGGSTDFLQNIESIRESDAEALFIASDAEDLILILPQLSFYEFGIQLLGTSAWNSKNLLRMAGRDMAGAVFPAETGSGQEEEEYRAAAVYLDKIPGEVNRFSVGGYSGVRKILEMLAVSESSGSGLKEEMKRSTESRQHQYIELINGGGIKFFTVRDEKIMEFMTLSVHH